MMALSGVRMSWLIRASRSTLAFAARSARRRASRSSSSFLLVCERSRKTAKKFGPLACVHGHRQRDQAATAHEGEHLASVFEQARHPAALEAREVVEHGGLAFRREQACEIALDEFGSVMTEQRFGAAVARVDVTFGVEHQDSVGRRIEDGAEFLGIGMADGGWHRDGRRRPKACCDNAARRA
jgi:hypothetical protein